MEAVVLVLETCGVLSATTLLLMLSLRCAVLRATVAVTSAHSQAETDQGMDDWRASERVIGDGDDDGRRATHTLSDQVSGTVSVAG